MAPRRHIDCSCWNTGRVAPFVGGFSYKEYLNKCYSQTENQKTVLIKSLVTHGWNICATEAVEISFKFINIGTKWDGQTNEQ